MGRNVIPIQDGMLPVHMIEPYVRFLIELTVILKIYKFITTTKVIELSIMITKKNTFGILIWSYKE